MIDSVIFKSKNQSGNEGKELLQMKNSEEKEMLFRSFPAHLKEDVSKVLSIIPNSKYSVLNKIEKLLVNDDYIEIFSRVYFDEPGESKVNSLSENQKLILNCIYTRHDDGFIRQKHLKQLAFSNDDFVIPYKVMLLGEYVIEIIGTLYEQLTDECINESAKFALKNEEFWICSQSRVASYWNEYYRRKYPDYSKYIGKKILSKIEKCILNGPMLTNSTEIYNRVIDVAERFGANNKQQLKELAFILAKSKPEELFNALMEIFKLDGYTHFQHQELAGYLLFILCPKFNIDITSTIKSVLKTWDVSVEQFPFYFCISYGKDEVTRSLDSIDPESLSPEEKDRLRTFKWWMCGFEKVMQSNPTFDKLEKMRKHYLEGNSKPYNK